MALGLTVFRDLRWFSVSSISRRQGPWGGAWLLGAQLPHRVLSAPSPPGDLRGALKDLRPDSVVTAPGETPTTAPSLVCP